MRKLILRDHLFKDCYESTDAMQSFNIPSGSQLGLLKVLRLNGVAGDIVNTNNGAGILFGKDGESAILSVTPFQYNKNVHITVSTDNGKSISWGEDLAFKSDVQAIQSQINDLKEQIKGITK